MKETGPTLSELPTLAELVTAAALRLIDVGGRGEALPQLRPLAPVAHYYTCEPDTEEAERLKSALPRDLQWRSVTVMTDAIASKEGDAELHLTLHPGMSSLLEPDAVVANRSCVGAKFRVVSTTRVPTTTLDRAAIHYGFEDATFLKLDTQGTELDILKSGQRVVDSLIGVYTESLFHPFYKGQSLFADVDTYLRSRGFSIFSLFRTMQRRADFRPDVYSRRMIVWAHSLYLREPDALASDDRDLYGRRVIRLLALALSFQHNDLALELLDKACRDRLFPEGVWRRVTEEVEGYLDAQSRRLLHRSVQTGLGEDALLKSGSRDNRYPE